MELRPDHRLSVEAENSRVAQTVPAPMGPRPDHRPSVELLESTHPFPGVYTIKAIGRSEDEFERRVVEAVVAHLAAASDLDYSVRSTPGGRHIALTLEISVQTAEQVRSIYADVRDLKGLTLLF
jgi:uncharacterized protein